MRLAKTMTALIFMAAVAMVLPAMAAADSPICHDGVLSNDAGQGCSDGLYEQVYGSGGGSSSGGGGICSDGILSNDAGQGCVDGLYEQVYGGATATISSASAVGGSNPRTYSNGSSNSMVNPHCESSGNSQVVSSNGLYWGKYQFDYRTWVAHGGSSGSYGSASEAEQDLVASRVTYDAWPNC